MPFPKTDEEREKAGYRRAFSSRCILCKWPVYWWEDRDGMRIPINEVSGEPHWKTCPKAEEFRKP